MILIFIIAASVCHFSVATDCTLPTTADVRAVLTTLANNAGQGGASIAIVDGPFYTCQVQGTTMGTYQQLSVIVHYTADGGPVRIRQFEMNCIEFGGFKGWENFSNQFTTPGTDCSNIGLRTDCSACSHTASNENHCTG